MLMAKDPYKLLNVPNNAKDAEIQKAYRLLAKKYHPDVNKDKPLMAEKFKEISAAYTLLSDKEMRRNYDKGQIDGSGQQKSPFGQGRSGYSSDFSGMGGQDDMASMFSSLFGMNMGNMRGGMQQRHQPPQKGADLRYKIDINFINALKGESKKLSSGLILKIPKGVESGQVLRIKNKGKPGTNGGPSGDVKVEISVAPHKNLKRNGKKLLLNLPISLEEAVYGFKISLPLPSGEVEFKVPEGSNTGQKLRLNGKGVNGGDLIITLMITLSDEEIKNLREWSGLKNKLDYKYRKGLI
jgi:DnaJ-class molecular chaperone